MAIDTFIVFTGVYQDKASADADYDRVKELFSATGLVDAYDAAVVERREDGKVKLGKKHETPTRSAAWLAAAWTRHRLVVALFPVRLRSAADCSRPPQEEAPCSVLSPGNAAAGMSRGDLKELGEQPRRRSGGADRRRRLRHGVPGEGRAQPADSSLPRSSSGRP
jgi:hypothetical protein